jgi:3D (Asp-Asp-Asp) domain-containing protein
MENQQENKIKISLKQKIMTGIIAFFLIVVMFIPHNELILSECKHEYKTKETLGSCIENGKITQLCEKCGDEYFVKEIISTGHNYEKVVVDPTCMENGSVTSTCILCGDIVTEVIPIRSHSFEEITIAPTCTVDGKVEYKCKCGEKREPKILIKKGHDYIEGFCSICGEEELRKESLGVFRITAYCPCYECSRGWGFKTSSGRIAQPNHTIAVDKSMIPYFTEISINEHIYVAEDTGGAIKGNCIDIFFSTHEEVAAFGVQYIEVYKITHPQNQKGD